MTRPLAPRPSAADAGTTDSVRCPRGCGSDLAFRSNSLKGGITEQCCYRCGTPWIAVPRRVLPRPVAAATIGDDTPLAALPDCIEEAVLSRPFCDGFGARATAARRALFQLRADGQVESRRDGQGLRVWRAA